MGSVLIFFTSLGLMEFQVRYLALYISSFVSNSQLQVVLDWKSSQKYLGIAGVPQGSILDPTFFLLYINDLPDDVICNIAVYADNTILSTVNVIRHLICGNN